MKILHLSDTHGTFPLLRGDFDVVVHSGDWLPDFAVNHDRYSITQENWIREKSQDIKKWIKDKPFLLCQGNHDFANPDAAEFILREANINAYNLEDKIVCVNSVNFYGFPYVPPINGHFAYETDDQEMFNKIDDLARVINKTYVDVLVAHCPPYGILSKSFTKREDFGNKYLNSLLDYKIDKDMHPQLLCVGHIHNQGNCIKNHKNMIISNQATSQTIIEL